MGRVFVRIPRDGGEDVRITLPQLAAISSCEAAMGEIEWHVNECGCCIAIHPKDQHDRGFVVDGDGGEDWIGPPEARPLRSIEVAARVQ